MQRHDGALEAGPSRPLREVGAVEAAPVGVEIPGHAARAQELGHLEEGRVDGRLAARQHRAPEAEGVHALDPPRQLGQRELIELGSPAVRAHGAGVIAALAQPEEHHAVLVDRSLDRIRARDCRVHFHSQWLPPRSGPHERSVPAPLGHFGRLSARVEPRSLFGILREPSHTGEPRMPRGPSPS
ncbi:MAG: hypothetical protein U1F43_02070 [Myxococcota bacterium]